MLQQREEELAAWQADVEVQEKTLTLRHAIVKERTRRDSPVHEAAVNYGVDQYVAAGGEKHVRDAPVFEYRAEDSEDEEVLDRVGYDREADFVPSLKPCEYEYREVSDEQIRRLREPGGMAAYAAQEEDINLYGPRDPDLGTENEDVSSHIPRPMTARELADEEYHFQQRRDFVPDEAQMSKPMPVQDWTLKHEAVSKLFERRNRGDSGMHRPGGEDAIVINAYSDQHGHINGKTLAWAEPMIPAIEHAEPEDGLPDYESEGASEASTIILSQDQGSRPLTGVPAGGNGHVRDAGLISSNTFDQMNRNLLGANEDPFVDMPRVVQGVFRYRR